MGKIDIVAMNQPINFNFFLLITLISKQIIHKILQIRIIFSLFIFNLGTIWPWQKCVTPHFWRLFVTIQLQCTADNQYSRYVSLSNASQIFDLSICPSPMFPH